MALFARGKILGNMELMIDRTNIFTLCGKPTSPSQLRGVRPFGPILTVELEELVAKEIPKWPTLHNNMPSFYLCLCNNLDLILLKWHIKK